VPRLIEKIKTETYRVKLTKSIRNSNFLGYDGNPNEFYQFQEMELFSEGLGFSEKSTEHVNVNNPDHSQQKGEPRKNLPKPTAHPKLQPKLKIKPIECDMSNSRTINSTPLVTPIVISGRLHHVPSQSPNVTPYLSSWVKPSKIAVTPQAVCITPIRPTSPPAAPKPVKTKNLAQGKTQQLPAAPKKALRKPTTRANNTATPLVG
jgi:hypothetical protein